MLDIFAPKSTIVPLVLAIFALFSVSVTGQEPDPVASQTAPANAGDGHTQALDTKAALDAEAQLSAIQNAITLSRQRTEQLRAEVAKMNGDRAKQNAALIAAAQRVKLAEIETGNIEKRLNGLLTRENEIRARLDSANSNVSGLLGALQRIGENPPPALIIDPTDALNSARSAALLSAILPQLRQRAAAIIADLNQFKQVKQAVVEEKQQLSERLSNLLEEQLRIATLIEARRRGVVRVNADINDQELKAQALAAEASSITQLIAALKQRISAVSAAANAADAADTANGQTVATKLSRQAMDIALANTKRTAPAVPFTSAKGFLVIPAAGVVVNSFGSNDGFGGISKGESIVTRAEAQIVAPVDGWVLYKGPYLNYGQIIIINPGQGYTILLAGLKTVSVELGQFILMGEPIGTMGSRTIGQTVTTSAGVSRPTLYIELRNKDKPLDPASWWATRSAQSPSQSG